MNYKNIRIMACVFAAVITAPAAALSREQVYGLSAFIGGGMGLGTYSAYSGMSEWQLRNRTPLATSSVVGTVAGAISYLIFSNYTPDARYAQASRILDGVKQSTLATEQIGVTTLHNVLEANNCYDGSQAVPLVIASQKLELYSLELAQAREIVETAISDEPTETMLAKKLVFLRDEVMSMQKTVTANKRFIKQLPDWASALTAYNQQLLVTSEVAAANAQVSIADAAQKNATSNLIYVMADLARLFTGQRR